MKKIGLFLFIIVAFSSLSFGQSDEYSKELKRMFNLAGTEKMYNTTIQQMVKMFKMQYSQVDEKTWDELEKEFVKSAKRDLFDLLVPVYRKHMSLQDLKELSKFYESPAGRKYAEKTPLIMQESMQVGQTWGMQIGQKFAEKIKEKGH